MKIKIACTLIVLLLISAAASANSLAEIIGDAQKFDGKTGIYAKNLKTGKSLSFNGDVIFPTASTSKLVVTAAIYKYLYRDADQAKRKIYDASVEDMIIVSGNDSFYEMLDEIEARQPAALDRVVKDLKLKQTMIHSKTAHGKYGYHSVTTPQDMAFVMETIYRGRYLGKQKSAELKNKLANTIFHDEIPRYMQTKVMHKVGELDNLLCDVGIVDDGKDQILISVYTLTERPAPYASNYIATAAAKAYNALRRK